MLQELEQLGCEAITDKLTSKTSQWFGTLAQIAESRMRRLVSKFHLVQVNKHTQIFGQPKLYVVSATTFEGDLWLPAIIFTLPAKGRYL